MSAKLPESIIREALKLQDQCWPHVAIAERLGVSFHTLTRRLSLLNKAALKQLEDDRAATKAKQIRQLERIAHEAMQGWERSREDAKTLKKIKVAAEPAKGTKQQDPPEERTEITVKGQAGNPGFLSEARAALSDIRDMLGLDKITEAADDKPPRIAIPNVDGPTQTDAG